jgi:hypothetical protein
MKVPKPKEGQEPRKLWIPPERLSFDHGQRIQVSTWCCCCAGPALPQTTNVNLYIIDMLSTEYALQVCSSYQWI